jgi:putative transposase
MSRLRRLVLSDRFFFLSCRVLPQRAQLTEHEFAILARVIRERRQEHGFLLTAWVFLPDHWHAIIYPRFPLTISRVLESIKVGATLRINRRRGEHGALLQGRFFDPALRTVREYHAKVEYIHFNPVKAGRVGRPEEWKWSSVHDYTGTIAAPAGAGSPIPVNRINLPADPRTRI